MSDLIEHSDLTRLAILKIKKQEAMSLAIFLHKLIIEEEEKTND